MSRTDGRLGQKEKRQRHPPPHSDHENVCMGLFGPSTHSCLFNEYALRGSHTCLSGVTFTPRVTTVTKTPCPNSICRGFCVSSPGCPGLRHPRPPSAVSPSSPSSPPLFGSFSRSCSTNPRFLLSFPKPLCARQKGSHTPPGAPAEAEEEEEGGRLWYHVTHGKVELTRFILPSRS